MYLVEVKYRNDSERKKIDYLLATRGGKGGKKIRKMEGAVLLTDEDDEIVKEIMSKTSFDRVKVYRVVEEKARINPEKMTIRDSLNTDLASTEKFIDYILAKNKAVHLMQVDESTQVYEIHSRKGTVRLYVTLKGEIQSIVIMEIEGFEPALSLIHKKIKEDIEFFKGGMK